MTINRVIFKTPVTGVDKHAKWSTDNHSCGVWNRVVDANKFDTEAIAQLYAFVSFWVQLRGSRVRNHW